MFHKDNSSLHTLAWPVTEVTWYLYGLEGGGGDWGVLHPVLATVSGGPSCAMHAISRGISRDSAQIDSGLTYPIVKACVLVNKLMIDRCIPQTGAATRVAPSVRFGLGSKISVNQKWVHPVRSFQIPTFHFDNFAKLFFFII